jgi:hypothetical protein
MLLQCNGSLRCDQILLDWWGFCQGDCTLVEILQLHMFGQTSLKEYHWAMKNPCQAPTFQLLALRSQHYQWTPNQYSHNNMGSHNAHRMNNTFTVNSHYKWPIFQTWSSIWVLEYLSIQTSNANAVLGQWI